MLRIIACLCFVAVSINGLAQAQKFTHADTLRGSITPQRAWWDLTYYHLKVTPNAKDSTLSGSTRVVYKVILPNQTIQIDLQEPLQISKVIQDGESRGVKNDGGVSFFFFNKKKIL
jgi:hypothetical protein